MSELLGRKRRSASQSVRRDRLRKAVAGMEKLEDRRMLTVAGGDFTLQLLHASDLEAGVSALEDAPRFSSVVNGLRDQMPNNTLLISSGDNFIPGPVFDAGANPLLEPIIGTPGEGRADIALMNAIGFDASAIGNHEFDAGPVALADAIGADGTFPGADFPYLSANLDFSAVPELQALFNSGDIQPSTIQIVDGEAIGIIGATTPLLDAISSPGDVEVFPTDPDDLNALAAFIQSEIDVLEFAGVDKIILTSHLQQLPQEEALVGLLDGVDLVIAGGSDTLMADSTDILREGDVAEREYPVLSTDAAGDPVAIVSTDGEYRYVGRLVIEFDALGNLLPSSIDPNVSGAFATDDAGEVRVGGTPDPTVVEITDALFDILEEDTSTLFGRTSVFLNGTRGSVRTEETNLGNLTADANLTVARAIDPTIQVSLKNGGGIRADIGVVNPDTGDRFPPPADQFREQGQINQLEIKNALRFDNSLTTLTVTAEELLGTLEHAVELVAPGVTDGRFPQIGGMKFSFDPMATPGQRVQSAAIVDDQGNITDMIAAGGNVVGDPSREIRMVTLGFIAGGGDGYFEPDPVTDDPTVGTDRLDLGIGEQAALSEYLDSFFDISPFSDQDTPPSQDTRIQNLMFRNDTVLSGPAFELVPIGTVATGVFDESAAEIVTFDPLSRRAFFTNSFTNSIGIIALDDPSSPNLLGFEDTSALGGGINSVDSEGGLVAAALEGANQTDPGTVALYDNDLNLLNTFTVGALPDSLAFTPDGTKIVVAGEGEPDNGIDPMGTISIIDVGTGTVETLDFTAFDPLVNDLIAAGVRVFPGELPSTDFEPEFVSISPDSTIATVTLQEANSLAVVDLINGEILEIQPLGIKDHSLPGNGLDPSDRDDGININNWPVFGMYMPDAIASFEDGGQTYYITANEGDARNEDDRIKDLTLDPTAFPDAAILQQDENLGRLEVSTIDGDTDGDGDFDQLFAYGSRSFTIWDSTGNQIFDSGDDFERIVAAQIPDFFNSDNDESTFDTRSDAKGPEPEAITVGEVDGNLYAFIGLERVGGIMTYDISDPFAPTFVSYVNNRDFDAPENSPEAGDLGVEDLEFVSAAESPNGVPFLLSSNEVSGTVTVFELGEKSPIFAATEQARWVVSRDGDNLVVRDQNGTTLLDRPLMSVEGLKFRGSRFIDSVTIDQAVGGPFNLPGGIEFDGAVGNDRVEVVTGPGRDLIDVYDNIVAVNGLQVLTEDVIRVDVNSGAGDDLIGATDSSIRIARIIEEPTISPVFSQINIDGGDDDDHAMFDAVSTVIDYDGGPGQNTVDFSGSDTAITFTMRNGIQSATPNLLIDVSGVQIVVGSELSDRLIGSTRDDIFFGLGGDDFLYGALRGNDILVGGPGTDRIVGGLGRDILIGGEGLDTISGLPGEDILVGGTTIYDEDVESLRVIQDEWTGPGSFNDRVDAVMNGIGIGGLIKLELGSTVLDDGEANRLFPDSANNLLF